MLVNLQTGSSEDFRLARKKPHRTRPACNGICRRRRATYLAGLIGIVQNQAANPRKPHRKLGSPYRRLVRPFNSFATTIATFCDEVCAQPMWTLAKKYGISDVGLAKTCRRLGVPLLGSVIGLKRTPARSSKTPSVTDASREPRFIMSATDLAGQDRQNRQRDDRARRDRPGHACPVP
jgi:hypothetical protein